MSSSAVLATLPAVTVAVMVKVFDGIVLAADSATTLVLPGGSAQVYNHANKVFHLHRQRAVGAMTWGVGQIGSASISTLAKDLRRRLLGLDLNNPDWKLEHDYTVEAVAERLVEMMFDELYAPLYAGQTPGSLGFLVAGYSGHAEHCEAWLVILDDPAVRPVPQLVAADDNSGWVAYAQPAAAQRLFNGYDENLMAAIGPLVPAAQKPALTAACDSAQRLAVVGSMPFQDAINFAKFLVDVTIGYTRFLLGPDTVGGQVELAGISRHEGFKWVMRKHYYASELNPGSPHEHDQP